MASLTPIELAVLEQAPGILLVAASGDGEVLFANRAFEELPPDIGAEGPPSAGDNAGVPPPTKDVLLGACRRVATSGAAEAFDIGRLGPAGPLSWYQCVVTPLRLDGRAAAAAVCRDVTAVKQEENALREALTEANTAAKANARLYAEAKKALGMRDDFLSIASHELRTPLTPLSLQLQLLRKRIRGGLRPAEKGETATVDLLKLIETSDRQLSRLSRLVDDLLDVSRIRTGRLTLMPGDVDLSELVREILDNFATELARAGCHAERQIQPHVIGRWDRVRIEQMVVNLLTNAIKYGAGKPIRVEVSADSGTATFRVQDFGIGIAREDQARIFDCFERAASVRHFGGLGLGLYIARQIAEHHGGSIGVESEPGEGATFRVTLPLRPGARMA